MEHEYIYRRKGGPVRRPSRHNKPPWVIFVLLALVVIAGLVILIIKLATPGGTPDEPAPSSSSQASVPADPVPEYTGPAAEPTPEPAASYPEQTAPDSEPEKMGDLMLAGGAGYEYYEFSTEATNRYITAVTSAGSSLSGTATVYSIVAPTSMDILLPESYLSEHQVDSADQRKAIDSYIIPSINAINSEVRTVPVFDALRRHCNENIYFGTHRTWTQLGAYYAYAEFCGVRGFQAVGLDQFEKKSYEGFQGYFAGLVGEDRLYSDTVDAYVSSANTSLSFTDSDGYESDGWSVISDGEGYSSSLLHLIFTAGDQPYKVLTNSDITDGSACVVVQDSFGNFFTPFLTQHYQNVYVVDHSTFSGNVLDVVREHNASDLIILSNVIMTSSSSAVDTFAGLF